MIETFCQCGAPFVVHESTVGQEVSCAKCGRKLRAAAAEVLPEGSGAGDFDARLIIESGSQGIGEQILLGGVPDITLGKLPDRQILLPGNKVSRFHCSLARLDFGPSRWELRDNNSTNGLFINGQRIQAQELRSGDRITIGEYDLRFLCTFERDADLAAVPEAKIAAGGPVCPSCRQLLPPGAKVCVACGVDVATGRSLVLSKGLDEEELAARADTWIRFLSWIIPFGLFPIASEAFGTRKPLSTWVIFATTCLVSVIFLIAAISAGDDPNPTLLNLMQWNGNRQATLALVQQAQRQVTDLVQEPSDPKHKQSARAPRRSPPPISQEQLRELADMLDQSLSPLEKADFHWYQLFTSALLHQPELIMPFVYHLGGNMLFLLVFGLRVNELVGNWRMSMLYPLMAVGSGLIYHLAQMSSRFHPSLGASGAIMGLAGMYFVFFPAQRVHMAIWFRGGLLTKWQCLYKVFRMRGIWLLALWIGFNDVLPMFIGLSDGVAHWAHIGGYGLGVLLALILLLSRQISAHGNDLLSVVLGKRAWALIGTPSAHMAATTSMAGR